MPVANRQFIWVGDAQKAVIHGRRVNIGDSAPAKLMIGYCDGQRESCAPVKSTELI